MGMTKTMRKVAAGDTLTHNGSRSYWTALAKGERAVVARVEVVGNGHFIELYDQGGRKIFKGNTTVRVSIVQPEGGQR